MNNDFLELFLKWTPKGADPQVREWLENRDLTVRPMKVGLLILGTRKQVEKAFSVSLEHLQPPAELPVPPELQPHVSSILLPKPREYHSS